MNLIDDGAVERFWVVRESNAIEALEYGTTIPRAAPICSGTTSTPTTSAAPSGPTHFNSRPRHTHPGVPSDPPLGQLCPPGSGRA